MAWDPKSLITMDQPAKKDDADGSPPDGTNVKPTLLLGTAPAPETPKYVFDPTKMPRRPSLAYLPTGEDDILAYRNRRDREPRRVHFDVNPEEMGVNPPSVGWFVCLSCTMFTLTLGVLLIAYYINKPSSNFTSQLTNATADSNVTVNFVGKRIEVTTVETEPTEDDGMQNAVDVIYHL